MSIKDMLFAEAMGLGGGGGKPVVFTATGWNELPYIDASEFFPALSTSKTNALGWLSFSFGGITSAIPVYVSAGTIAGGATEGTGTGATLILTYDNTDKEWNVTKAWTNLMGSWTDITSSVQTGASDIELTLFR